MTLNVASTALQAAKKSHAAVIIEVLVIAVPLGAEVRREVVMNSPLRNGEFIETYSTVREPEPVPGSCGAACEPRVALPSA